MNENEKRELCIKMATDLPLLRKAMGVTQIGFASMVGVTRSTIIKIERSRNMGWNMFLSFLMVLCKNEEAGRLLPVLGLYPEALDGFLCGRNEAGA